MPRPLLARLFLLFRSQPFRDSRIHSPRTWITWRPNAPRDTHRSDWQTWERQIDAHAGARGAWHAGRKLRRSGEGVDADRREAARADRRSPRWPRLHRRNARPHFYCYADLSELRA